MKDSKRFEKKYNEALDYINEVIVQFARSDSEEEDLIQEFTLLVHSDPKKYEKIIDDNQNVFRLLQGISRDRYKLNSRDITIDEQIFDHEYSFESVPEHDRERLEEEEAERISEDQKRIDQIESILYKAVEPVGRVKGRLSVERQWKILEDYKDSLITIKKFATEKNVEPSTMRLLLNGQSKYKFRNGYSYAKQQRLYQGYLSAKAMNSQLSITSYAKKVKVDKTWMCKLIKHGPKQIQEPANTKYGKEVREAFKKEFKERKKQSTQRVFCKKHGISTQTLYRLLKNGPTEIEEPKSIKYYKLHYLSGWSYDQIAQEFSVTNHTIAQQIHDINRKIKAYLEQQMSMEMSM